MTDILLLLACCSITALLGSLVGAFAGLVPGLHPNTLATVFSGFPQATLALSALAVGFQMPVDSGTLLLGCFLIGILMAHSLTEIIPTAMLGITDDETVVSLLPSQRLYGLGRADLAIESVIIGGLGALLLFAILLLPTRWLMGTPVQLYSSMKPFMGLLLLGISGYVILSQRDRNEISKSIAIFILSGMIGIAVLTAQVPALATNYLAGGIWKVDSSTFLLPAFSGMFALPSLVFSGGPKRNKTIDLVAGEQIVGSRMNPLLRSIFPSMMVGWLPGITNAYATSFSMARRRGDTNVVRSAYSYLITYSATNIGGSLQSILAMGTILRFRNGTLEAINGRVSREALTWFDTFDPPTAILAFLWAACVAMIFGAWLCPILGRRVLSNIECGRFRLLRPAVILSLLILAFVVSGPVGLFVLFSCFLVGAWAISIGAPRVHLMGFLLVPVIIYFLVQ
jgi:putative membrane protein